MIIVLSSFTFLLFFTFFSIHISVVFHTFFDLLSFTS